MGSKREEKKKAYKERIINAAYRVFSEVGYENATIEQISKEAEVGLGTTYIYFKSKSELYKVTMEDTVKIKEIVKIFEEVDYDNNVSLTISKISKSIVQKIFEIDRSVLKEYFLSLIKTSSSGNEFVYDSIINMDNKVKLGYIEVLNHYKKLKKLNDNFDSLICADIIFYIILEVYYDYIALDSLKIDDVCEELEKKIQFIITPYEIG